MATDDKQVNSNSNSTIAGPPIFIGAPNLRSILTYKTLIHHLRNTLPLATSTIQSPIRQSHQTSPSSSLLLMPSWSLSSSLPYIGVKLVTTHPNNSSINLPGIHASYVLFNSATGQTLASMDGTELTFHRTACVSALASYYLSNNDSQVLLMVGSGFLAPHLIKAHLTTRPNLKRVLVWNRNAEKAKVLVEKLSSESGLGGVSLEASENLKEAVEMADIVSCATNSKQPLVLGKWLKKGAHLDLVGSYKPSMRECDDDAIRIGNVFVDNEAALEEAGELVGAFERGVIEKGDVKGDLVGLIKGEKGGRCEQEEITVFKSVGSAIVDLLSAQLVYETCQSDQNSTGVHTSKDSKIAKKEVRVWTIDMDNAFIEAMLFQHRQGNRPDGSFTSHAYNEMVKEMNEKIPSVTFKKELLKNRLKTIKKNFSKCYDVFNKVSRSGFGWNSQTKRFEADDEVWDKLIESNKDAAEWRHKTMNKYDVLEELFAKDRATGEGAETAKEKKRRWAATKANSMCEDNLERIDGVDFIISENEVQSGGFVNDQSDDVEIMSSKPSSQAPTESSSTLPSRRKKKKIEKEDEGIREELRGIANAIKESTESMNLTMRNLRQRVYSPGEIANLLWEMKLDSKFFDEAYIFLGTHPQEARQVFGYPSIGRMNFLEKRMFSV